MPDPAVKQSEAASATKQSRKMPNHFRHSLKCAICNHPDRAAIEFDFLNWRNPGDLVKSYRFRSLSTIYRHAHATGLFAKRRLNLRFAMERIVERVNEVPVTATAVIRAARAIARINDSGEWVDPPSRLIVTHTDSDRLGDAERSRSVEDPERSRRASRSHVRHSSPIFDSALLDEPSDSSSAELPRVDGKPAPPEIILELSPGFASCREERRRALEADRQANAAKNHAAIDNPVASGNGMPPSESLVGRGFNRDMNAGSSSSSLLPQAVFPDSASSALPHRAGFENNVADNNESVALPPSTLPEAAPDKPATACPEQSRGATQAPRAAGPPLGSSGSADPPFPFTQESRRRWKPRRHF